MKKNKTKQIETIELEPVDMSKHLQEMKAKRPLKVRLRLALNHFFITKYCKLVTFGRFSKAVSAALDIGLERGMYECNMALQEADPKLYKKLIQAAILKEKKRLASLDKDAPKANKKTKK